MRKIKQHLIDLFFTVEFLKYFVSGVVATLVNLAVYMGMSRWLGLSKWYFSDVPAIILSVLAAYVLNRIWVFRSSSKILDEFFRFIGSRLAISFFFEYAGIYFVRHVLGNTTELVRGTLDLAKLIALAFVVIANRVSGKFYVFRTCKEPEDPVEADPLPETEAPDPQFYLDRALETIRAANVFANKDSSDRAARLYRQLGDPWRSCPAFHIAGTNGKGSISSYLTHCLCQAGHKVGWYTSPYLERFNERIRVLDGTAGLAEFDRDFTAGQIPDQAIARLMPRIEKAAEEAVRDGGPAPTQFDLMTALAFLWFQEEACDVLVLETGMGGRLDSTNVIEKPLACLIGAPGFDHMERLGDSMREIMGEKAGIVKTGCPVFAYAPEDALLGQEEAREARLVLTERCRQLSAPLQFFGYGDFERMDYGWSGQRFRSLDKGREYSTRLLGLYQPIYALLARAAVLASGMADEEEIQQGIAACVWPARMEVLSREPLLLLDGAHNVQACLGLRESLAELACGRPLVFVVGLMADKQHREMLEALLLDAPYKLVALVATEPDDKRRLPSSELIREAADILAGDRVRFLDRPDPGVALLEALMQAREEEAMICVCGSLYLAGQIRPLARDLLAKGRLIQTMD